jgi:restriction endonuclease S subunit
MNGSDCLKLGDCAKVRTGLVLSRKVAITDIGTYQYVALTLKALTENSMIDHEATEPYSTTVPLKREYFTYSGDILLRLSTPYTAALITKDDEDLLVSSHFTIIRAKQGQLDSRYLYWWLTQNRKRFYKAASGGTMMGTISSGYVGEMEIALPPITEQKNIGSLIQLANREQQLLALLAEKKKQLIDSTLRGYIARKGGTING